MDNKFLKVVLGLNEPGHQLLGSVRKHAAVELTSSISALENLRWVIAGLDKHGVQCFSQFEEGLSSLESALKVIQLSNQEDVLPGGKLEGEVVDSTYIPDKPD